MSTLANIDFRLINGEVIGPCRIKGHNAGREERAGPGLSRHGRQNPVRARSPARRSVDAHSPACAGHGPLGPGAAFQTHSVLPGPGRQAAEQRGAWIARPAPPIAPDPVGRGLEDTGRGRSQIAQSERIIGRHSGPLPPRTSSNVHALRSLLMVRDAPSWVWALACHGPKCCATNRARGQGKPYPRRTRWSEPSAGPATRRSLPSCAA